LRQAVQALNPKKGDPSAAPGEYDAVRALLALVADEPPPTMRIALFRSDTALGRLALLALASLNPLRRDGAPVDVAQALQDHGIAAVTEFVRGRRGELAARGFWPVDALPPTGDEAPEILQSHGIVSEAADALRAGNVDAFLEARRNLLSNLIHRFLEVRVEAKALIRPPLADLIVGDEPDNDLL